LHLIEESIDIAFAHNPDPRHSQANSTVQVFDKTTGKYLIPFAGRGDGDENMEKPEGIAMDPQGHVCVANYTTGYIKVFDNHSTFADLLEIYKGTNPRW
jgi:DNA-binding beta-propeller fold protein YncE